MSALAILVVLLVSGPPLVIVPVLLALCVFGLVATGSPRRARTAFTCPVRHTRVIADFAVPVGAGQPGAVLACSAFADPSRVSCAQRCLETVAVRWTPPVGAFARWALTADGLVTADAGMPAPR
jgi:hypothetical protein